MRMPATLSAGSDPGNGSKRTKENRGHAAKCQAVIYAGDMLRDVAEHFWDTADFELTVTDEKGLILFTVRVLGTEAPAIRASDRA